MTMRSLLFVPADSQRKCARALQAGADALILDLEDSIAAARKAAAREGAVAFLADARERPDRPVLIVRINALGTGLAEADLDAVMPAAPDAILLPKAEGGADIEELAARLAVHEAETGRAEDATAIHALVTETAAGLVNAGSYANRSVRLKSLIWGAEDLSADIGALAYRDDDGRLTGVFALARTTTLIAAAAAGVAAVDAVYPAFSDLEGLAGECRAAVRDGFSGKLAIHPAQVPVINEAFTPDEAEIAKARRIIAAFAEAGDGTGVVSLDGHMVDEPHRRLAERVLARAGAAGRT